MVLTGVGAARSDKPKYMTSGQRGKVAPEAFDQRDEGGVNFLVDEHPIGR